MDHRCPDEETLAAYFDGLLAPETMEGFQRDLLGCPDCARLLGALGMVIAADTPTAYARSAVPSAVTGRAQALWPAEPSPIARGLRLAVRWLDEKLAPLADALSPLTPAGVAVRGAGADEPLEELHYAVTVGNLPLEIDLEVDGPSQIAMSVRSVSAPPPGLLLRLSAQGVTRAMSSLTATGANMPALPLGEYTLSLEQGGESIGELELSLGG